jgi:hypothetical protein
MARTPSTSLGLLYTGPLIGFSAVRITGNTVVAPLGRALSLTAQGATVVTNNNLTSRGAETQAGTLGAAVSILNLGYTYEIAALLGFSSMALNAPGLVSNTGNEPFVGGEILFSGNQVLLAPYDNNGPVVFTSVELIALDDVEFEDNQCVAQMSTELLIVHGFVLAWSTRMNGNRFEEAPTFGLSGASIAVMNCTTMNQGTRCFAVIGIPSLTVNTANRSLVSYIAVSAGDPDPCLPFQDRFNKAMVSYGFNP